MRNLSGFALQPCMDIQAFGNVIALLQIFFFQNILNRVKYAIRNQDLGKQEN